MSDNKANGKMSGNGERIKEVMNDRLHSSERVAVLIPNGAPPAPVPAPVVVNPHPSLRYKGIAPKLIADLRGTVERLKRAGMPNDAENVERALDVLMPR